MHLSSSSRRNAKTWDKFKHQGSILEIPYLEETEIGQNLLGGLNRRDCVVEPICLNQCHNLASNRIIVTRCDRKNYTQKGKEIQTFKLNRKKNHPNSEKQRLKAATVRIGPWSATLTACSKSDRWMCLLREAKRSSMGGGGCDGEGEGFGLSLGFGAMDFPERDSFE